MTVTHTSETTDQPEGLAPSPEPPRGPRSIGAIIGRYGLVIAWALVVVLFGSILPGTFLTGANAANILGSQAVVVVLTLAVLFPMTSGDFDMSAASVLTLSAMIVAQLNVNAHWPIGMAVVAALAAGAALGFVNGFITTRLSIDPFIVTLGTGTFANGLTLWVSGSNTVSGIDASLVNAVVGGHLFDIPLEFFYALVLCAVIWWVFEYTRIGRLFTIVGQGRQVARLSGAPVTGVRTLALTTSGLIAAFAGVLYAGNSGAADPTSGTVLLLPAFAGAFLGATVIKPGRYNPWGSIIAVYFLVTGITGLQMLGASSFVQDLFYGAALVAAVALSRIMRRNRTANEEGK
jgi:ribose transport system permease protein